MLVRVLAEGPQVQERQAAGEERLRGGRRPPGGLLEIQQQAGRRARRRHERWRGDREDDVAHVPARAAAQGEADGVEDEGVHHPGEPAPA